MIYKQDSLDAGQLVNRLQKELAVEGIDDWYLTKPVKAIEQLWRVIECIELDAPKEDDPNRCPACGAREFIVGQYTWNTQHLTFDRDGEMDWAQSNFCCEDEPIVEVQCKECETSLNEHFAGRLDFYHEPEPVGIPENGEAGLRHVARAQTRFWDSLRQLEQALGFEIDSTQDLRDATLEQLTTGAAHTGG